MRISQIVLGTLLGISVGWVGKIPQAATKNREHLYIHTDGPRLVSNNELPARDLEERILRLEQLDLTHMLQGWGDPGVKKTILDKPLTINGKVFTHGVGTHAVSRFSIDLKGVALAFRAQVGVDDEEALGRDGKGSVCFNVYVDEKKIYSSGVMKLGDAPRLVEVDLKGARRLDLEVLDGGDTVDYDHADWADAFLRLDSKTGTLPESMARKRIPAEILSPPQPDRPRINAPGVLGAGPNREFQYYIPIVGKRPMKIRVQGLPQGIALDRKTGILRGVTGGPGDYSIEIEAENQLGKDSKEILLKIGSGLALTPPLGWNSWNCWAKSVNESHIRAAAEAFVETGLIDHGWTYVCIDDTWEGSRDPETLRLTSNEKFPNMKALGDFIHSKGLKFGLYTDVGYMTCQQYEGSRGYEFLDADTFARWGVDYVKADWCYAHGMRAEASYKTLGLAIQATGRDMVYSVCTAGYSTPWQWGEKVGGHLWRTGGDIRDNWHSVYTRISEEHYRLHDSAGPGHWNDPDMLVVGRVGWGPTLRDSELTANQQYSHISLWCLLAAPMILGCDLAQIDPFTLNLLTNDEVLAVNQDEMGNQAQRLIQTKDRWEVWSKDLADGSKAVGVFNLAPTERDETALREYTLDWNSIGLSGPQSVRDLWRQKDLGVIEDSCTVNLPEFSVCLMKIVPVKK